MCAPRRRQWGLRTASRCTDEPHKSVEGTRRHLRGRNGVSRAHLRPRQEVSRETTARRAAERRLKELPASGYRENCPPLCPPQTAPIAGRPSARREVVTAPFFPGQSLFYLLDSGATLASSGLFVSRAASLPHPHYACPCGLLMTGRGPSFTVPFLCLRVKPTSEGDHTPSWRPRSSWVTIPWTELARTPRNVGDERMPCRVCASSTWPRERCTHASVVHNPDTLVGWPCYVYACVMHMCAWQPENAITPHAGCGILRGLASPVEGPFLGGNTPWLRTPSSLV